MTSAFQLPHRTAGRIVVPIIAAGLLAGFALHSRPLGWALLAVAAAITALQTDPFRRHLLVIIASLTLLSLAPVGTGLSAGHFLVMGPMFIFAAALPSLVLRRFFHDHTIKFPLHHGRRWHLSEILYLLIWAAFAYFLFPIYFADTGSYHNWEVALNAHTLVLLFGACLAVGIWDELFFVNNILGIFRRYLPFVWANAAQAVLFTTFLWEFGFRGWAPIPLLVFTYLQGHIYRRTQSLVYVISIHLTVDIVLFLALINAYFPDALPIFLT